MVFPIKKEEPSQDSSFLNKRFPSGKTTYFLQRKFDTLLTLLHLTSYYFHIPLATRNTLHRNKQQILFSRFSSLYNQSQLLHNVSHETIDIPNYLSTIFDWFQVWASYENLAKTNIHAITPVLAVVPILQEKAFLLLACFSFYNLKQYDQANRYLQQYLHWAVYLNTEKKEQVSFREVDMYMKKLVEGAM